MRGWRRLQLHPRGNVPGVWRPSPASRRKILARGASWYERPVARGLKASPRARSAAWRSGTPVLLYTCSACANGRDRCALSQRSTATRKPEERAPCANPLPLRNMPCCTTACKRRKRSRKGARLISGGLGSGGAAPGGRRTLGSEPARAGHKATQSRSPVAPLELLRGVCRVGAARQRLNDGEQARRQLRTRLKLVQVHHLRATPTNHVWSRHNTRFVIALSPAVNVPDSNVRRRRADPARRARTLAAAQKAGPPPCMSLAMY